MRHHLDGNAIAADAHYDQAVEIGNEDGETCGRVDPPDEDAPRGYKPKPCQGVMEPHFFNAAAAGGQDNE